LKEAITLNQPLDASLRPDFRFNGHHHSRD